MRSKVFQFLLNRREQRNSHSLPDLDCLLITKIGLFRSGVWKRIDWILWIHFNFLNMKKGPKARFVQLNFQAKSHLYRCYWMADGAPIGFKNRSRLSGQNNEQNCIELLGNELNLAENFQTTLKFKATSSGHFWLRLAFPEEEATC